MNKTANANPVAVIERNILLTSSGDDKSDVGDEDMPEKMRPEIFPYFYLLNGEDLLENWAGTNTRKMSNVLKRHIPTFSFNE